MTLPSGAQSAPDHLFVPHFVPNDVDRPPTLRLQRRRKRGQTDEQIAQAITTSSSFREAASKLGISVSSVRKHARRLNTRSAFRYGRELLPSDDELRKLLQEAASKRGICGLARDLGVRAVLLSEKAAELGVDGRRKVRPGLPDDETLIRLISQSDTMSAVARQVGVPDYTIRNQARRLQVWPGQKIAPARAADSECGNGGVDTSTPPEFHGEARALYDQVLEHASQELTKSEAHRHQLAAENVWLKAELVRLRNQPSQLGRASDGSPAGVAVPSSLDELFDFIASNLGPRVVVLPKAIKETRKATGVNVGRLYDALVVLRDAYVPMRIGAISMDEYTRLLRMARYEETASKSDANQLGKEYDAYWGAKKIKLNRHLKSGTDPKWLIRIYFYFCEASARVIVGWMPTHLPTSHTN